MHHSLWLTVENTSITVVRIAAGGSEVAHFVVVANDCHHLYDPVLGQGTSVPTNQ